MKIYTSIISLAVLLLFAQVTFAQRTIKRVLFFGNSYTAGLPELISKLASSAGDSLIFSDASAGQTIKDHATSPSSFTAISSGHWDYVVIQVIAFPWINLVWAGTIIMVIGFVISVLNRIDKQKKLMA